MKLKIQKSVAMVLGFISLVYFYSSANAYVLPGPLILDIMTKELGTAERLFVAQRLSLYSEDLQEGAIELEENLKYLYPYAFRSDILSEKAERIHVLSNDLSLTVIDGIITAEHESEFDHYKDILLYNSRPLLEEKLPLLGVDVSVSSLGRFQGRIGYVLGAQYPDESVPQVWIDKNTFKPFRWIILSSPDEDPKNSLECRYFEWRQVNKIWYPMRIEFYLGDNLVRMIQVDEIRVDPPFAEHLFDIRQLKKIYPRGAPVLTDQQESNDLGEVQKALEEFKKIVE
jgi:hypothetical protein